MAKVRAASLLADVRGTIGGVTFSANRAGIYARRVPRAVVSHRPKNIERRQDFTTLGYWWRRMRDSDVLWPPRGIDTYISHWNYFAEQPEQELMDQFGDPYYASGYNWFMNYNTMLEMAAQDFLDVPPVTHRPPPWPDITFRFRHSGAAEQSAFKSPYTTAPPATHFFLYARLQYGTHQLPSIPPFTFLLHTDVPEPDTWYPFQSELEAVTGTIPEGTRLHVQMRTHIIADNIGQPVRFSIKEGEEYTYTAPAE